MGVIPQDTDPLMASPFRPLVLSGAIAMIIGGVIFVQMATWDAIGASGAQHAAQDASAAQAIGRLDGAISALQDVADAPDAIWLEAHARVDTALEFVDQALDATDVQSVEAQDGLATARAEADAVAEVVAAAQATNDPEQRSRHLVGAGVHTFELRRAQGRVAHARQSATHRLRSQGRLSTFLLFGAVVLCIPLAFSGFSTRQTTGESDTAGVPQSGDESAA